MKTLLAVISLRYLSQGEFMIRNTTQYFGSLTKFFHWTLFFLICIQFYLIWGQAAFSEKSPIKIQYVLLHKSFGISILILGILFILWRMLNPKPHTVEGQPNWKRIAATAVHHSLLLLIVLMPIIGYLMSCAAGKPVRNLGLFTLPCLIAENDHASDVLFMMHTYIAYIILLLIAIHVLAALQHHFILKDKVLKRMLPFSARD